MPVSGPAADARDPRRPCFVLGYDRTDSARRAASWAAGELAPGGKLVIVHACRPLHAPPAPLSTAPVNALLASNVGGCTVTYTTGGATGRTGVVALNLQVSQSGESVRLFQQVHINNVP